MGEGQGMRAYTLTPYPSPKIKAFWERGIILLKIRGDNSERSVPTVYYNDRTPNHHHGGSAKTAHFTLSLNPEQILMHPHGLFHR